METTPNSLKYWDKYFPDSTDIEYGEPVERKLKVLEKVWNEYRSEGRGKNLRKNEADYVYSLAIHWVAIKSLHSGEITEPIRDISDITGAKWSEVSDLGEKLRKRLSPTKLVGLQTRARNLVKKVVSKD